MERVFIVLAAALVAIYPARASSAELAFDRACLDTRIFLELKDTTVSSFLRALSEATSCNYIASPGAERERLTATIPGERIEDALSALEKRAGLTHTGRGNVVSISRRGERAVPDVEFTGKIVTLDLHDASLRATLEILATALKRDIVLDLAAERAVTIQLSQVPADQALAILLHRYGLTAQERGRATFVDVSQ